MFQGRLSKIQGQLKWNLKTTFNHAQEYLPDEETVGSRSVDFPLCTFTEFDPLKCVIVGYVDETASVSDDYIEPDTDQRAVLGCFPKAMVEEGQRNLNALCTVLQQNGVQVVRVGKKDWSKYFDVYGFKTPGFCCYSPRDIPFIYHDSMYEFPTFALSRLEEYQVFQWIQKQLSIKGSKIFTPWRSITSGYRYTHKQLALSYQLQDQYFGEAANLLKLGLDIIFLISSGASRGCYNIFKKNMDERYKGKVRVHPLDNFYKGIHIDSCVSIVGYNKKVKKYIAVVEGVEKTNPTNLPAIFRGKNWALISFEKHVQNYLHPDYQYISFHMGLNFLMVNPQLAIIVDSQVPLAKTLQFYGIKSHLLTNKHMCQLAGGFHCNTNDIYRQDVHGFGEILQTPRQHLSRQQLSGLFDPDLLEFLQSKGKIQDWVKICNQNKIFPTYLTDHLSEEEKDAMLKKHQQYTKQYKYI